MYTPNESYENETPYGSSPEYTQPHFATPDSSEPEKPQKKKEKKPAGRGFVALMMVLCLLLSGTVGALAGFAAGKQSAPGSSASGTPTSVTLPGGEEALSVADVASLCSDSVVAITTESVSTGHFMQQYVTKGAGSGVILSEDGYIVTNNHVIDGASTVTVTTADGKSYAAKIIGTDSELDVALLKVEASGLKAAELGDSDQLVVGQATVVIGNPLGTLAGTVTNGVLSALDREITLDGQPMNLLQTNAAVNPGNSGGGMFDSTGKLIGIVNAKSAGEEIEGIGFAIPINDVKDVLDQLKNQGYVSGKLKLGITMVDVTTAEEAQRYGVDAPGVYIAAVNAGSLAEKSGLQVGDRIVALNGIEITGGADVQSFMKGASEGDKLQMTIVRSSRMMTVDITIVPNP